MATPDIEMFPWQVLNPVQTLAYQTLERNPKMNVVVATGTGTGKTFVAELVISRLRPPAKAIVMEPLKALAHEKVKDWSKRFPYLRFIELTSDVDVGKGQERNDELVKYDVIVCSFEMLDSMTRKPAIYTILNQVGLLVIDEVHELGDETRGGSLDGALTRFLLGHKPQVIALSATFDNVEDLKRYLEQFVSPVEMISLPFAPIDVHVTPGIQSYVPQGRVALMFTEVERLMQLCDGGILAMCLSISDVQSLTQKLNEAHPDTALAHYSELSAEQRHEVEDVYRSRTAARVIVSTPTLLAGVNIPCQGIVLDISFFDQNDYKMKILPITKIRQAIGRVGRLPWYKQGWVTYICHKSVLPLAKTELQKPMLVRGTLFSSADSVLNTEIQLLNVTTQRSLLEWYKRTYSRFSNHLSEDMATGVFNDEIAWLAQHGYVTVIDKVTGRVKGEFKGLVAHQHFVRPRFLSEVEGMVASVKGLPPEDGRNELVIADGLLTFVLSLAGSKYAPFSWTNRKRDAALKLMGYETLLNNGEINWAARDENFQWVRDVGTGLTSVATALKRLGHAKHPGFTVIDTLASCFESGCIPPKLARLRRLLTTAGVKGIGYKRLAFLYANGVTVESIADGKVPQQFGLPNRSRAATMFEAKPEDFYDFGGDFTHIIPERTLTAVLTAIGRQSL